MSIGRLLFAFGTIAFLAWTVASCSPPASATQELLLSASELASDPDGTTNTPANTSSYATSDMPAVAISEGVAIEAGRQEVRLTPDGTRLPESVPTLEGGLVTEEVPQDLLEAILVDAAGRTGSPTEAFTVVRGEAVTWNDGSLGCPQPDMMYTQALVPGYWIVLEAGDKDLDYRAAEGGFFSLCEGNDRVPFNSPGDAAAPTPEQ